MAYSCPRCSGAVQRGGHDSGSQFGLVGMLFTGAFGGFNCKACGDIPKSEFPPEVRSRMTANSFFMLVGAIAIGLACLALLANSK